MDQIRLQQSAALVAAGAQALAGQVDQLRLATGEAPVAGPGVVLTVNDAPQAQPTDDSQDRGGGTAGDGRVLDRDLQTMVNGLWSAGAEAVAVNGRRLTVRVRVAEALPGVPREQTATALLPR